MKNVQEKIRKICRGITFEQKQELLDLSADLHRMIIQAPILDKNCSNCHHCVKNQCGEHCCTERNMRAIPFEVVNRVGGCSKWLEKDFLPF